MIKYSDQVFSYYLNSYPSKNGLQGNNILYLYFLQMKLWKSTANSSGFWISKYYCDNQRICFKYQFHNEVKLILNNCGMIHTFPENMHITLYLTPFKFDRRIRPLSKPSKL